MNCLRRIILPLALWIVCAFALTGQAYTISQRPNWTDKCLFDKDFRSGDSTGENGITYLLIDNQYHAEEQQEYTHKVYRINTEGGLQQHTDVWCRIDQSYQDVSFHKVNIIRNGKVIPRLNIQSLGIWDNEPGLQRGIFYGTRLAGMVIEDLRVGDIVEVAHTVKGSNPAYDGKLFANLDLARSADLGKVRHRLLLSPSRNIHLRNHNTETEPEIREVDNGLIEYEWEQENITGKTWYPDAPESYYPYPYIEISEFSTWKEVIDWGRELYSIPDEVPTLIRQKTLEVLGEEQREDLQMELLVDYVQNEVRYIAMEMGASAYRPHSPQETLQKKFGDCKDKSYLLLMMLKSAGIEANIAFVSTTKRGTLPVHLPSPLAFDHAILFIPPSTFIDATISHQGGRIYQRYIPDYSYALVISEEYDSLVPVEQYSNEEIYVTETIQAGTKDEGASYRIRTDHRGGEADKQRMYMDGVALSEVEEHYRNFYHNFYPGIEVSDHFKITDDPVMNQFVVEEFYHLPHFWARNNDLPSRPIVGSYYALTVNQYLSRTDQKLRSAPLAIYHPVSVFNTVHVSHKKGISIGDSRHFVENDIFRFNLYTRDINDTLIELSYSYRSLKNSVEPGELDAYFTDLNKVDALLGFEFPYEDNRTGLASVNYSFVIVILLVGILCFLLFRRIYRKDFGRRSDRETARPFGGWLLLLMLGVIVSPFRMIYDMFAYGLLDMDVWFRISQSDGLGYSPTLVIYLTLSVLINTFMIAFVVYLNFLMFRKRVVFRPAYILFILFALVVTVADFISTLSLFPGQFVPGELFAKSVLPPLFASIIWIPYMLISKRAKATFVNTYGEKKPTEPRKKTKVGKYFSKGDLHRFGQ